MQGETEEVDWKMDYGSCSKLFMEYGKIDKLTISSDGKTVTVKYGSMNSAAKAWDALISVGYEIGFVSHFFQHLAESKLYNKDN